MKEVIKISYIDELIKTINDNNDKRIIVIGTTCTGKSTIIDEYKIGRDMDKEIFPLLTEEEKNYVCQEPWTEEIGMAMNNFVRTRLKTSAGNPLFTTVFIDCDLVIYLHISDELLKERTFKRNVDYNNAKNMQASIEKELKEIKIPIIKLEVEDFNKKKCR